MPPQEGPSPDKQPDPLDQRTRPPSDTGIRQILVGEDVLEEARTLGRRIMKRVWRLLRPDADRSVGKETSHPEEKDSPTS
jgi:hypothetical protein